MVRKTTRRPGGRNKLRDRSQSPVTTNDGRDREDPNSELEAFPRRAQWWREYHGDASGVVSGELRRQAIAHAERLAANGLAGDGPYLIAQ
jgi:hypothetical protein